MGVVWRWWPGVGVASGGDPLGVFCFDVCTQGTVLEGATLEIIKIPGLGKCRQCATEIPLEQPFGVCHVCNSVELDIIQGQELKIKEMEVEELSV